MFLFHAKCFRYIPSSEVRLTLLGVFFHGGGNAKKIFSLFVKPANFSVIHKKEALKGKRKIYCSGNYIPLSPLLDSRVDYWETILYGIAGKVIAFLVIVILEKLAKTFIRNHPREGSSQAVKMFNLPN